MAHSVYTICDRHESKTLEQKFNETIFRQIYLPPNHLGVVFRGNSLSRFIDPDQAGRKPFLGQETLKGSISLDTRFMPFMFDKLCSKDGIPFEVEGKFEYTYDPRVSSNVTQHIQYLLSALEYRKAIEQPIMHHLNRQFRRAISTLTVNELMDGFRTIQFEQKIGHALSRYLTDFGVSFKSDTSLSIEYLAPPTHITKAYQRGYGHKMKTIGHDELSDRQIARIIQILQSEHWNIAYVMSNENSGPSSVPTINPSFVPQPPRSNGHAYQN